MRLGSIVLACLLAIACFCQPAAALNPDHLTKLQDTNACVNCDLSSADFAGKSLRGADLRGANLQGANLSQSVLMAVDFRNANLEAADLSDASLIVVDLRQARLKQAITRNTDLKEVRLCHTVKPDGSVSNRDC